MKRFAAIVLSMIIFILLAGCQPGEADFQPEQSTAETQAAVTLPPPAAQSPQETIRIAMRPESDLNPLFPKHYTTISLLRLVYEPLYRVSHDGRLEGVLAKSCRWSGDGLECRIELEEGHYFQNGQAVTAEDARASLTQFIASLALPRGSGEAEPLDPTFQPAAFSGIERWRIQSCENVMTVAVNGEGELVISLREPDPLLPRLLLFPVVPAGAAQLRSLNPPSGSGEWLVESYSASGLVLARKDKAKVSRIEALVYPTAVEAAYGFDQGEIDLLLMDYAETGLFADRSRIRKQRLEDGGFISLFFSNSKGKALENRDALLYIMAADPELASMAQPFSYAAYPALRGDFRFRGLAIPPVQVSKIPQGYRAADDETYDDEAGKPVTPQRPSFTLLAPQGLVPAGLIDRLSTALLKINRKLQVNYADAESWIQALSQGRYDAVLLVDSVFFFSDPADYLDGLQALGLYRWTVEGEVDDRPVLLEARLASLDAGGGESGISPASYIEAIHRTFESLPLAGLAATGTMVWYSKDIEGTMSGTWCEPYRGVEELLIWRR